jgi:hypothetical protein
MTDYNNSSRNGAQQRAVRIFRRWSIPCAVLATALIGAVGTAHAVDCRSEKGEGYPWAWRQIDGKRCWYKGKAGMDKKLLRWADNSRAPAAVPKPAVSEERAERERLLHSYWPLLPPVDVFNDRFDASRAKRL